MGYEGLADGEFALAAVLGDEGFVVTGDLQGDVRRIHEGGEATLALAERTFLALLLGTAQEAAVMLTEVRLLQQELALADARGTDRIARHVRLLRLRLDALGRRRDDEIGGLVPSLEEG